ncbi:MAG: MoaD/ThiS family protein [Rhodanobacteraceae bacterium]|nr:MoaD/ThiS family protein [Rhodanobacteraceae bacterium]MBK7042550.1 MoaD/ThiS family protein [Rhodanobacteraceae bacterium]MBP9153413.1 MoaD/ThiS family protein [Xanthomonadales bacterium]HQW82075.1 MoaD/ThiS family protein [Pseudomonadota bacterium]
MRLSVRYFASLRDAAGCDHESIVHQGDAISLYQRLAQQHRFTMPQSRIRLAVNGALVPWVQALGEGDEVVFLPPVSGG